MAGSWRKKLCQKPRAARLYGVLNYDMAVSDTPHGTYVLRRDCGVCVGKRTISATQVRRGNLTDQVDRIFQTSWLPRISQFQGWRERARHT